MRLNYYRFPEGTPVEVLMKHGCQLKFDKGVQITWRDGTVHTLEEPTTFTPHEGNNFGEGVLEKWGHLLIGVDDTIGGVSVTTVKNLMKEYGGIGWTEHIDRDGGCFEVTDITIKGNNSRFKYNHHL